MTAQRMRFGGGVAGARRRTSLVLFAGGSLHLAAEGLFAFLGSHVLGCKTAMLMILGAVAILYFCAAALVSPGEKRREIGIALLATAGWIAAAAAVGAMVVALLHGAGRGYLFDLRYFDAWLYGFANLLAIVAAGTWLTRFRQG